MKSRTLIGKQLERKFNPDLVETILSAKKKEKWVEVAGMLSSPRRRRISVNLDQINLIADEKKIKDGDKIVVAGKILGQGELQKKLKIVAFSFSKSAVEKLQKSKVGFSTILEEIKSNPEAKEIKILK